MEKKKKILVHIIKSTRNNKMEQYEITRKQKFSVTALREWLDLR